MKSDTKKTILVIDDSTTNIVLLEAVLNARGYGIDSAVSVKDANNVMAKRMPDLILLDLLMPKVNGHEFLIQLKSNDKTKNIPVIVVSALSDQENIERALDLGACEFIKKPVDIPVLLEMVKGIFK